MNEGQARYEESQVELAWLAEPMLFSLNLAAQLKDNTLAVRGYVPTAAVRDHALKVAREQTTFRVVDELKIYPAAGNAQARPTNPRRSSIIARQILVQQFPERGKDIEVKCDPQGRVTVAGPSALTKKRCSSAVNSARWTVQLRHQSAHGDRGDERRSATARW